MSEKTFTVKCHCGRVRARFQYDKPSITAWDCNCSDCGMRRNIHFMIKSGDLEFEMKEELNEATTLYEWGTKVAKRRFCKTCGILPWYVPRSNPDGIAITLGCVDFGENSENLIPVEVKFFDGIHWEESFAATSISNETK
mmetsp:Transcript_8157/g.11754  ORF Transcript_8157/g.11754 Transcript_8157/m.11754 type:complete len:140 (+) Transcript_8157:165-584(+)